MKGTWNKKGMGIEMKKKNMNQYIVEREFLARISVKELIVRIVKFHTK